MADWTAEFSTDYEIPKFIQFLVSKKILEDSSWHNDAMPSFGVFSGAGENSVQLWVDHPFMSRREMGMKRFAVTTTKGGDQEEAGFATDDLDEALEHLFQKLAAHINGIPPGVFEWRPKDALSEGPWEDPGEYLGELKDEYVEASRG